jgi:hypothetical protein
LAIGWTEKGRIFYEESVIVFRATHHSGHHGQRSAWPRCSMSKGHMRRALNRVEKREEPDRPRLFENLEKWADTLTWRYAIRCRENNLQSPFDDEPRCRLSPAKPPIDCLPPCLPPGRKRTVAAQAAKATDK